MPLTPLHLGFGLFLGALNLKFFNLWAILLGSVAMDVEPLILIFIRRCCSYHGFWHSILGGILGSAIIALILWNFRTILNKISLTLKIHQSFSFLVLFYSSLAGWTAHIIFDSLTHYDVFLFWPIKENFILAAGKKAAESNSFILIGSEAYWPLNFVLFAFGILGLILFIIKYPNSERGRKNPSVLP